MMHAGIRHRLAQVFLWLLGSRLTRDQYRQSARHRADGAMDAPHDPDRMHQAQRQAHDAWVRRQQGGTYGRAH